MASYQRVALYLLFDSIEQDLIRHIRRSVTTIHLTNEERAKAEKRLISRDEIASDSDFDFLQGLDISEKYDVLLRHKDQLPEVDQVYFRNLSKDFTEIISVRNSVMHARPLTIHEYSKGFIFAQNLLRSKSYWPTLTDNYYQFNKDPSLFTSRSIEFLDDPVIGGALHNLPTPEHDDTGFLPRPELERELRKRILGRHPVVTILGEGGNGKTALALQTLHSLVMQNDHPFDAVIWTSAKTSMLTAEGVRRMGDEVVAALSIVEEAASFEPGVGQPLERLKRLLAENKILLVIDNLETIQGDEIKNLSEDVPGESKLLLTSRVPLGGDLSLYVGELSEKDGLLYMRRLIAAYEVRSLRSMEENRLQFFLSRLHYKPLLIKWFVIGVKSGLDPNSIIANPKEALQFCLENVFGKLCNEAKVALTALATLSKPLSAQLIHHITMLSAVDTEAGLNEASRFGLIDFAESSSSEQLYKLRPFARSYVMRVISPKPETTSKIRDNYNRIEYQYQQERGQVSDNPYSMKNFKVRSAAEMLAAKKLKNAVRCAIDGYFDNANDIIEQVRITDPGFFETYRSHGHILHLNGDITNACIAYEAAIELAPDEPQLHFFYASMLMRSGDLDLADEHFEVANGLDPDSMIVHREYARNCLQKHDFKKCRSLLEDASKHEFRNHRERTVHTDLEIQYYVRLIEYKILSSNWAELDASVRGLAHFVYSLDLSIFDDRMAAHLVNVLPSLKKIQESREIPIEYAVDLTTWIEQRFGPRNGWAVGGNGRIERASGPATGRLKSAGLQSTFGFLKADDGREAFIHSSEAGADLWASMIDGQRVRYDIVADNIGRLSATNVTPI